MHYDDVVDFTIDGHVVETTEDHPFWNVTDNTWQQAQELDPGDRVLADDGSTLVVGEMAWDTTFETRAFNLTVDGIHTYYVGTGDHHTLVHNTNTCKRWQVGDDVYQKTAAGNNPAWSTVRARHWKNEAANPTETWNSTNMERMKRGRAPQRYNDAKGGMESKELSHEPIPFRDGGTAFTPRWPQDHALVDNLRRPGY